MKKIIAIISILVLVGSCKQSTDKKSQLESLLKERDKLNEQILKLEKEVAAESGDNKKVVQVTIEEIKHSVFKHFIEVQGKVDGEENVGVTARTPGVVTSIAVTEGQAVTKGQLLATLDSQVLYATLADMENQLGFVTDLFNRQKNLWEQNIGSEVQYLTSKNNKESLESKIKTLKDQISMAKITSPINGTVEEISVKIGQMATPGFQAFRVVNFNKIKVVADVAEAYSPKIKSNDSVLIFFPDLNEEIGSKLSFTSKFINNTNRTFIIESRINPVKHEMRANMIAIIKINDYKALQAIAVPANLIQKSLNEKFVFVVGEQNGKKMARKQKVETGLTYNGLTEITSGLNVGDKVITSGYLDINQNDLVNY